MKNAVDLMIRQFKKLKGQSLVEYALIIGLIATFIVLLLGPIPDAVSKILAEVEDTLNGTP